MTMSDSSVTQLLQKKRLTYQRGVIVKDAFWVLSNVYFETALK